MLILVQIGIISNMGDMDMIEMDIEEDIMIGRIDRIVDIGVIEINIEVRITIVIVVIALINLIVVTRRLN
jgi:hypothetical protein